MDEKYESTIGATRLAIIKGDIVAQDTAAIVIAANSALAGGGGVDGAIHAAGGPIIIRECRKIIARIGKLEPGRAVVTQGGDLLARYVIHTVGPVWSGGNMNERQVLRDAYINCLAAAKEKGALSVSFPSISTGAYGFPVELAAGVALLAVKEYIKKNGHFNEVRFVLFNAQDFKIYSDTAISMGL